MICLAPRAREDSVRPRRPAGVVTRPLNFTVRSRSGIARISGAAQEEGTTSVRCFALNSERDALLRLKQ